jgi:hypothetical protein
VNKFEKRWLEAVPWQTVLTLNQTLCQAQNAPYQLKEQNCAAARQLWERSVKKSMTLPEALDVLKKCYDLSPFLFNNANTFAAISKTLIEDWVRNLPPLEGQIIRNTVSHYVAGLVGRKELLNVLKHFEATWKPSPAASPAPAPQPQAPAAPEPAPVVPRSVAAEHAAS